MGRPPKRLRKNRAKLGMRRVLRSFAKPCSFFIQVVRVMGECKSCFFQRRQEKQLPVFPNRSWILRPGPPSVSKFTRIGSEKRAAGSRLSANQKCIPHAKSLAKC